ncbi:ClpXP protease specificity-enhancing factor [Lysobacter erysipheiresistens]|uniref:ClpXP protease specificity-enhancing factor n=2 Tax=Novilysobacter erysipheiresistens TaxID=1749332 RepID=A0ABU7YTS0_9GAMM
MTSHRPYLLRALYEWIADNGMTPHLLVDATRADVQVPKGAVKEGRVVLNIADRAVSGLEMSNELIRFSARFGGVSQTVSVPVGAVLAIYARETGQGMALPDEVQGEDAQDVSDGGTESTRPTLSAVPSASGDEGDLSSGDDGDDDPGDGSDRPRRGPHLRVVK